MIYQVKGDILRTKAQVLAQTVSINDAMDRGLGLSLHNLFPAMHKDFHHWCHQQHPKPGEIWIWGKKGERQIACLITREGFDSHDHRPGKSSLVNVNHALRSLAKQAVKEHFTSIALPKLASGLGGLDWHEVFPLIERHLGELAIPVFVYVDFHPGQLAQEPGL